MGPFKLLLIFMNRKFKHWKPRRKGWKRKERYYEKYDKEHPKITIRLDKESFEILEQACTVLNMDRSTFIRELLKGNFVNKLIELSEVESELKFCNERLEELEKENEELLDKIKEHENRLRKLRESFEKCKDKVKELNDEINHLRQTIESHEQRLLSYEKILNTLFRIVNKFVEFLQVTDYVVEIGLIKKETLQFKIPTIITQILKEIEEYIKKDKLIELLQEIHNKITPGITKLLTIYEELKKKYYGS